MLLVNERSINTWNQWPPLYARIALRNAQLAGLLGMDALRACQLKRHDDADSRGIHDSTPYDSFTLDPAIYGDGDNGAIGTSNADVFSFLTDANRSGTLHT